jgi:uncharacterized repeat protein (TIGR01451 family)
MLRAIGVRGFAVWALLLSAVPAFAVSFTSTQSGDWSDTQTWGGAGVPGTGDDVTITSSHIVTVSDARIALTVTLDSTAGNKMLVVQSGGSLLVERALPPAITVSAPSPGSTNIVRIDGGTLETSNSGISIAGGTTASKIEFTSLGGTATVAGDLTFAGTSANAQIDFGPSGGVLNLGKNLGSGGTILTNPTSSIVFDGTGAQTINSYTFHHLSINKSGGTATLNGPVTVNGSLSINQGVLDDGGNQISLNAGSTSTVSMGALGVLKLGSATSATTFPAPLGTVVLSPGSAVVYQSGLSQTINNSFSYERLYVSTMGGAVSKSPSSGTLTVNDELKVADNGVNQVTLLFGSASLDAGGDISGDGTITMTTGSINVAGDVANTIALNAGTGTVTYDGLGAQQVVGANYMHLVISKGGGTATLGGNASVAGALTVASGTFDAGANTITLTGDLWVNGSAILDADSATIKFNASATQTFTGATTPIDIKTLEINNPAGLDIVGIDVSVNTALTLNGGKVTTDSNLFVDVAAGINRTSGWVVGQHTIGFNLTPARTFHIGTATAYIPVTIDSASPGTVTLQAGEGLHPFRTGINLLSRFWTIDASSSVTSIDSIVFNYNQIDFANGDESKFHLHRYNAGWTPYGDVVSEGANSATAAALATYAGDWVIGQRGSMGAAGHLAIVAVNGGTDPSVNTAFDVDIEARHDDDTIAGVTSNTNVSLAVFTGSGNLGGTTSGTINASTGTTTISGVIYDTQESGVVLRAAGTGGDPVDFGDSSAFNVVGAPSVLFVTSINDSGAGTLRDAITTLNANNCATPCTINFSTAGNIVLSTPLPVITRDDVTIDGFSAPGASANSNGFGLPSNATLTVGIDGGNSVSVGFDVQAQLVFIKGLVIKGFANAGVVFTGPNTTSSNVSGCYIGTDFTGQIANGNAAGVHFAGSTGASAGGFSAPTRNVISGNTTWGVITSGAATGVGLYGNYIGTKADLSGPLANLTGVKIDTGAAAANIGSSSAGNIIAGNSASGLVLAVSGNSVKGNYIGIAGSGGGAMGNATGIQIDNGSNSNTIGGASPSDVNYVGSNSQNGILISGNDNVIDNNFIGLASDGTTARGNGGSGIRLENAASNNRLGTSFGNKLVFNTNDGVSVATTAFGFGNAIRKSKIAGNSNRAIDLGDNGLTPNDTTDSDTGPNNLQNFPVLTDASYNAGSINVKLSLNSSSAVNANFFAFDVFREGSGQAIEYLGSSGCVAGNVFNNLSFSVPAGSAVVGNYVVATATAYSDAACSTPSEGTSELSASTRIGGEIHWINAGGGAWETAANWNPATVPTTGDVAYIDATGTYTVTINSAASVGAVHVGGVSGTQTLSIPASQSLTISAGSTIAASAILAFSGTNLAGVGSLAVLGTMNWNSGTMSAAGGLDFNFGSTLNIATAATKTVNGTLIEINPGATVNWSGGNIEMTSFGSFDNYGDFEITTDASINEVGFADAFSNYGTFRKSITTGATTFNNVTFDHNGGTVDIQTGRLNLADGTAASTITIGSGADLFIDSDTYTFAAGTSVSGLGKVHVSGGTLNVTGGDVLIRHLLVDGGTIGGSGVFKSGGTGNWVWSGGTMSGSGQAFLETGATMSIGTASPKNLVSRIINIQPGVYVGWFGTGAIQISSGGSISNSGTFDVQNDASMTDAGSAGGFVNTGTFSKTAGTGTTTIAVPFTNNGTVQVGTGTFNPSSFISAGPIQLTGTLVIDDSTAVFNAGTDVSGSGLLHVNGGTLTATTSDVLPNLQLDSGTINGAGSISVTALSWNGGTMGGAGTTTIPTAAIATVGGVSPKFLQRTLTVANGGTANVTGAGTFNFSTGGNITNDGLIEVTANVTFNDAGSGGDINNTRTFRVNLASGFTPLIGITFNNTGALATTDIVSGSLNLADGTSSGAFAIAAGSALVVDSDAYTFASGTTVTGAGSVQLSGGTLNVTGNVSLPTLIQSGGTLDGSGVLTLTGAGSDFSGGVMQGGGTTVVANAATLALSGFSAKSLDNRTLSVAAGGTVNLTGGSAINLANNANVANGGTFNLLGNHTFSETVLAGDFVNTGTVTKSGSTGPVTFGGVNFTNNGGTVDLQSGTVAVNSATFTQSSGLLKLWLNGTTPGTGFAQVSTTTTANLAGTLEIALVGPYQPNAGDTFNVISAPSHVGDFTQPYTYPALAGGRTFSDAYTGSGLVLTVSGTGDLSIAKSAPANVAAGAPIAYTLAVSNAGPDSATGVSVSDVLQTGHTAITASGTGWTCNVNILTVTCTAATLATGAAPSITINANAPVTPQTFTNVANVTSSNDPVPGNNSGSAIVTVDPSQANLGLTSTEPAAPLSPGTPFTFDFTISNGGPATASNVVFTAPIPATLTYNSATPDAGTCTFAAGTVTCNVGNILNGATLHVLLNLTTSATGTHAVTGSVTATEGDPVPANNVATPEVQVSGGTITVTHTGDSGAGSLRQALLDAQNSVCTQPCTIAFNIPAPPYVIAPLTALPDLGAMTVVDATTQPGYAGTPVVQIDGGLNNLAAGLLVTGSNSGVRGLSITGAVVGIDVAGPSNVFEKNYIGLDPLAVPAPNSIGIRIASSGNVVGGSAAAANDIASNGGPGIKIMSGAANAIRQNRIYDNAGIGIDLNGDGVTTNDAGDGDTGPNGLQNTPVVSSVSLTGGGNVHVAYGVDSSATGAGSLRVEFFEADTSGEGRTFLFTACVAGNAFNGGTTFAAPGVVAGDPVVLTATSYSDPACTTIADGTSEFSNVVAAAACTPPVVNITGPTATCGPTAVTLDAGPGFMQYAWSTGATTQQITVTPATTATYTVTVTTNAGCQNSDTHTVTVNTPPAVNIAGPTTSCALATVTLDAGPGFAQYAWSNGAISQQITVTPSSTQTYSVTVTDGNNCQATDTHTVTVTANPTVTITGPTDFCAGAAAITLDAGPGYTSYSWSTGATSQQISVSPASTTTYTVTVGNGSCQATDTHTVNVNTPPVASITPGGPTTFCAGNSLTLTASNGASWLWSNGATSQQITVTSSGSYSVQVSNGTCAATSAPVTVTVNPQPVVTITGPTATCGGAPVTLDAGSGFTQYNWSNGATTQQITVSPSSTQTFTVTVTDGSGCTASDSHTVAVSSSPAATISSPAAVCENTFGNASVASQPGASYTWTVANGTLLSGQGTTAIVYSPGTSGSVSLGVSVVAGSCTSNGNTLVPIVPRPAVALTAPSNASASQTGLTASVPVTAGASYQWTVDNGTITAGQGTNSITFSTGASGITTISIVVSNAGCSDNNVHEVVIDGGVQPSQADIAVTKSAPATVLTDANIDYSIGVINRGAADANGVVVTDNFPAGTTFVSMNAGPWSCTRTTVGIRCTGTAQANTSSAITLTLKAPAQSGTLLNVVDVTSVTPDADLSNNSASASTSVIGGSPSCATTPPSLQLPAGGANVGSPVTFSWTAVSGATGYELWINDTLAGMTSTTTLTRTAVSGTSTWFVVARLASGCLPLTSASRTFTVAQSSNCGSNGSPIITSPPGGITASSPTTFLWTAVPNAIGYRLMINSGGVESDAGTTEGETSLTVALPAGTVTATVQALFSACPFTSSAPVTVTVPRPDPCAARTTASLLAPANNAVLNGSSVTFDWAPVANASGYRVWVSIDGAAPAVLAVTTAATTLHGAIARGEVVWFVESLFEGCASTESQPRRFTIPSRNDCTEARPELLSPTRNAETSSGSVHFTWSAVPSAIEYELWASFANGTPALIGTTTSTALTRIVPPGRIDWFVRAIVDRCPARDSQTFRLTFTQPPACGPNQRPMLVEPLDGSETSRPVSFAWSPVANAVSYDLFIIRDETLSLLETTTGTEVHGVSLGTGAIRWFVRANFGGNCSPLDSTERSFEIVAPATACSILTAPGLAAPGQISSGVPFLVQWTPVNGATSYQLQLAGNASFAGAQTVTTAGTSHALLRNNGGTEPLALYVRVRAIDSRCTPSSVSTYGAASALFILPGAGGVGSAPAGSSTLVQFAIPLGTELAGRTFVATPRQSWLTVTPSSGVVGANGTTLNVIANTAGLPTGTSLGGVTVAMASNAGSIRTNDTVTIPSSFSVSMVTPVTPSPRDTPPPDALIIPAVAHAGGINSQFQSDVRVSNTSGQPIEYLLTFTPSGDSGITQGQQSQFSIDPGRTIALDDILKSWFGTGNGSAMGTLEVRPLTQTATSTSSNAFAGLANLVTFASSRTFNLTSNGTFGQYIPAIPFANFIGREKLLSLQQIAQSNRYRTNLGIVEGSGNPASLIVRVFGGSGEYLTEFNLDLRGGQHMQLNSFLRDYGVGNLNDGRVEIEVVSGDGLVTAYASVLDNETSDPLLVTPVTLNDANATKWVMPGVADLVSGFANWQTDMRLFNAGRSDADVTMSFYSQGGGAPKVRTLTIKAGEVRQFDRTLATLFETANDGGAVHISTSEPAKLIATARTYNQVGSGTYGQFISAVTPAEAAGVESRPLQLLQVEESERFRSNIGLVEVTGKPVRIEISAVPPDAKFTAVTELELGPNEFRQLGSLLKSMGLDGTYNARVTVRAIDGEGRVTAYASVIDMLTNDPTYVPAQ